MKKFILYIIIIILLYSFAIRTLQSVGHGFAVQMEERLDNVDDALQE